MFDKALLSLPGMKRILGVLGVLAIAKAAAIIGQAWTLATAIANLWSGEAFAAQLPLVAGFLACFLVRQALVYAQDALLSRYAATEGSQLRERILSRAFTSSVGWVRSNGTASVTTAALEGIDQVENYIRVILPKIIDAGVIVPATLVATLVLDWPSAVILAIVVPVIIFYMILLGRMAQDRATRQYATYQVMSNHFIDTLRGLGTLKALGAGKRQVARIFKVSESFRRATVKTLRVATLSGAVLDLFATLGVAAVAMMLGFRLVDGSLDLFTGLAALMLAPEYFAPLRQFAGDFHASLDGKNALADILALTADESSAQAADVHVAPWDGQSTLELNDASFSYPPDEEHEGGHCVLEGASLVARGFERIGIVGPSGSGKSTLAYLLGGFHTPDGGEVRIDGRLVPRDALQGDSWREQVLFIPQNPYIFNTTLRENIAFYTPDASEQDIQRAVDALGLDRLVNELPQGLDTVIGEGGRGLSGGQAQRIALARALLDPKRRILIFDEPTAHLDIETELELKERMLPLMKDHLVFFATHRRHWLQDMDRVYQVEDGKLVEMPHRSIPDYADCGVSGTPVVDKPREAYREHDSLDRAARNPRADAGTARPKEEDVWVRPYFGLYRGDMGKALVLGVGAAAFAALLMFTAGYLISGTAEARGSILFYYLPIASVQLFGLGKPVLRYFERLQSHDWVFRMTSSLRVRLFKALEAMGANGAHRTGEVLGVVADDIGHIQNLYLRTIFPLIIAWIVLVLAVIGFGVFDWAFAGIALAYLAAVGIAFPAILARLTDKRVRTAKSHRDELYATLTDDMLGAADWVFSGRGGECRMRQLTRALHAHEAQDAIDGAERLATFAASALLALFSGLVLWWAATIFGNGGNPNWIAAFMLGLFPLMESLSALPTAAIRANGHRASIQNMNQFPNTDDETDVPESAIPAVQGSDIAISQLRFAYPADGRADAKPILDGISLQIPAGQKLAILGPSGSGKSTFASLLRGELAPGTGEVTLGGVPATQYDDAMAQFIGVVPQNPYLFNRSIRENLLLAKPDADDDELWRVLEQVQLDGLVRSLPRQLATMMDEAGMRFSGGERHRFALARVLLADTPVVLLDEPTVGLDPETEQGILDTLLATMQGKTLILITHHLQGIEGFDRVVFLENGHIELDGSPAELAEASGRYRALLAFDGVLDR